MDAKMMIEAFQLAIADMKNGRENSCERFNDEFLEVFPVDEKSAIHWMFMGFVAGMDFYEKPRN